MTVEAITPTRWIVIHRWPRQPDPFPTVTVGNPPAPDLVDLVTRLPVHLRMPFLAAVAIAVEVAQALTEESVTP